MALGFGGGQGGSGKMRLLLAAGVALLSVIGYFTARVYNPITEETQHIRMSVAQEIALGVQAAPEMGSKYGGLSRDAAADARVDGIGAKLVEKTAAGKSDYKFEFHVLADAQTINAFALPGGQVFITEGLLRRLRTEGELAGVLGHEVGHVVARHGAEHLAKAQLTQGLTGAAAIATYDPNNPNSRYSAAAAAMIANLVTMKFGRDDELESDRLGVKLMAEAGYDPRAMAGVMEVLSEGRGRSTPPEFFSTHPNPENRVEKIQAAIAEQFPGGVPGGLVP